MKYAIWSVEHQAWWRPGKFGYTPYAHEAGLYSEDESFEILRDANRFREIQECLVPEDFLERKDVLQLFGITD